MNDNIKLLYVDLFCGAGGTSTGVEQATLHGDKCAKVIACVNHDPNAIRSHAANHPETHHFTEDIRTLDMAPLASIVTKARKDHPKAKVVLWASLECTNFSKAKGGQPRDADSRTLANHLFRYIETIHPDFIQIENVEEFMSWGEMDENGKPISKLNGTDYVRWCNRVQTYGYSYVWHILNAADYGAYTSRRRFFGQFAKNGLPHAFPTRYKLNEIVAVAQSYKELDYSFHGFATNPSRSCGIRKEYAEKQNGWGNKMFVSSKFMPHQIKITDIRIERLQDISEEDALKEGIVVGKLKHEQPKQPVRTPMPYGSFLPFSFHGAETDYFCAKDAFAALIDKPGVGGPGTWERNPWVFVYSFKKIK